jgi:hypothetical protein
VLLLLLICKGMALSVGVAVFVSLYSNSCGAFCLSRSGGPIELDNGSNLLPMPPVAVVLDQRMIQKTSSVDGDTKKRSFLDRDLFAVSCSVTDDAVTLFGFNVTVQMESPASGKCWSR